MGFEPVISDRNINVNYNFKVKPTEDNSEANINENEMLKVKPTEDISDRTKYK